MKVIRMSNGRIPEHVIDAVLKAHDIVEIVGRHVHLTKQGHYLKGLCPFHSEKTPSFTVTPERQIYHCFGCGAGGNAIRFISEVEGLSFGQAVRKLANEANLDVGFGLQNAQEETKEQAERAKLLEGYEMAAKLYQYILHNTEQGKAAKAYLRDRGMNDKLIETFGLGYAPARRDTLTNLLDKKQYFFRLWSKADCFRPNMTETVMWISFATASCFRFMIGRDRLSHLAGEPWAMCSPNI